MAVIPSGYMQVNFQFSGVGIPTGAEMVLGFSHGDEPLVTIASDINTAWPGSNMDDLYVDEQVLSGILIKKGPNDVGASGQFPLEHPGTDGGTADTANVALLIHKNTDVGGRAGRGRSYLPGVNDNVIGPAGEIDSLFLADAITHCNAFLTDMGTAGYGMVVLHGPDSPLATPSVVESWVPDAKAATQRRRLRR